MRTKLLTSLGVFVAPPVTIFPLLNSQDKGLKVITLEGSGSLFEPIQLLTKKQKTSSVISVLPTGSAGGKEALKEESSELALTSLSEQNTQSNGLKETQLATDPISLVFKKGTKCQFLSSPQNNSELPKKLFENSNDCKDLVLWVREGGYDRSNLNKTTITSDQTLNLSLKIQIREAPENNFLALEKFLRENDSNSAIFFPTSFYELNKDLFSALNYEVTKLQGNQHTQTPKLQKELNLIFKAENINGESELKQVITSILLETQALQEKFQLSPKSYCDSTKDQTNCSQQGGGSSAQKSSSQDIKTLFETSPESN